jgi:hypothetical protein
MPNQETIADIAQYWTKRDDRPAAYHVSPLNLVKGEQYQYWYISEATEEVKHRRGIYVGADTINQALVFRRTLETEWIPSLDLGVEDFIPYRQYVGVRYA